MMDTDELTEAINALITIRKRILNSKLPLDTNAMWAANTIIEAIDTLEGILSEIAD